MQKLKSKVRDMQTPIDDSGILPRYQEACKLPPSPHWSPSQGPSSWSDNSMDSLRPSPCASGSLTCLLASLSRMLFAVFTIKLSTEMPRALFPLVHDGGHTTNAVGVISQDYKPLRCTTMVRASTEW
jgi:hypothetical protein